MSRNKLHNIAIAHLDMIEWIVDQIISDKKYEKDPPVTQSRLAWREESLDETHLHTDATSHKQNTQQ
jgi:hypothetical protein